MEGKDGENQLWCAGFVCNLLAQASRDLDMQMPFKRQVSVDRLVEDSRANGRFLAESTLSDRQLRASRILPGSLFVVRKNPTDWTHVGIVTNVEETLFLMIEGNTNGHNSDGGNAKFSNRNFVSKDFLALA